MKHKYAEMIKAKAENMDLVIIAKNCQNNGDWWALKSDKEILPSFSNGEYFACLPQHKEACFHWLNGGEVQYSHDGVGFGDLAEQLEWDPDSAFMDSNLHIRIKPKKEKRWIAVRKSDHYVESITYLSEESAEEDSPSDYWTHHEIEVEV